jgi:hypothetical protein
VPHFNGEMAIAVVSCYQQCFQTIKRHGRTEIVTDHRTNLTPIFKKKIIQRLIDGCWRLCSSITYASVRKKTRQYLIGSLGFELESAKRIYLEVADEMFTFHANELFSKTRNAFKYFNHGLRSMCTQLPNYYSLFMQINRVFFDYKTVIEDYLSIDT